MLHNFRLRELEHMMMEAQTRGQGLGIGTNYRETEMKSINGNEQVVRGTRVPRFAKGFGAVTEPHIAHS